MNAQKDIWSYGALWDGGFYGPLEFLECDDVQEALQERGITVHMDEFDRGDEKGFEMADGRRLDVEEFANLPELQEMWFDLGADFAHVDYLSTLDAWIDEDE